MNILICNVGSTSLKYQLLDMNDERVIAKGKMERVGTKQAQFSHQDENGHTYQLELSLLDHGQAISKMLEVIVGPVVHSLEDIACVGFKVVLAKGITGVQYLDEKVLQAMEVMNPIAPAHNPPYIAAIRQFRQIAPSLPLVGSFETGFHQHLPPKAYLYSIPKKFATDYGIRRYGYHGASHEYIYKRIEELTSKQNFKLISCHLGGSGSLAAIVNGISIDTTLGFSLQTGIMHNNRIGDIDPYIPLYLMEEHHLTLQQVKDILTKQSGLLGLSGVSNDMRDIELAAAKGNLDAQECIETYAYAIKKQIGAYAAAMNGVDVIAFGGGIGENSALIRELVLSDLDFLGVKLDASNNKSGLKEGLISTQDSRVLLYVVATNEEIIVARKAKALLENRKT